MTVVYHGEDIATLFAAHVRCSPRQYARATVVKRVSVVRRYLSAVDDPFTARVRDVEQWAGAAQLGASATRDLVSHVRAFYRWAIREGLTDRDPTVGCHVPPVSRRLPRPARDVAIAAAVAAAPPVVVGMIALMAGAGLRCCEVARVRWVDVDMIAGTVYVTGKGNRDRVLELAPAIRRALAAIDHPGVFVFVNAAGDQYGAYRVSQIVNAHLRSVGAGCTAHQLRHRFATRTLAACRDLTVVRDLLGHASIQNTEIYAAVTPGAAGAVCRSIDVPGL